MHSQLIEALVSSAPVWLAAIRATLDSSQSGPFKLYFLAS